MKRRVILLLITIIFLAACVRSSSLIKKLNQNSYPLWYSYDTVPTNEKKDIKLGLSKIEINTEHFPNTSTVKKHKGTFIPLIAFLYWDYQYSCYLGKEAIRGDVGEFIKTSFLEESKRSGIYSIEENCADCDFTLHITVNDFQTMGPYVKQGWGITSPYGWVASIGGDAIGPARADTAITFTIFKDNILIFEKRYVSARTKGLIKNVSDYSRIMVETLSFAFKDGIEKAVQGINEFLRNTADLQPLDTLENKLKNLKEMKSKGLLSDKEYLEQKSKIIDDYNFN